MRTYKQLATRITIMAAAAALVASSAFAETRHQNETRDRVARHGQTRTERPSSSASSQRSNGLQQTQRSTSRTTTRSSSTTSYERYRGSSNNNYHGNSSSNYHGNNNSYHGSSHSYGYAPHQSYYHSGRITSYHAYHGGYRVYVAGAPFPFFVPYAYWDPFHFRIGFSINLGGYYNPAGYYDYYGYAPPPPYAGPAPYAAAPHPAAVTQAVIRGTVESVDYRGLTFVMRNESTGSFVTVDNSLRELHDVRPGDYVEVAGDWTRDLLYANNIAFLGNGRGGNPNEYPR